MKSKNILIASLLPTFWIALAIWSVGEELKPQEHSIYTGSTVVLMAALVIPIAVVAFFSGKNSTDY